MQTIFNENNFLKHQVDINTAFEYEDRRNERRASIQAWLITLFFHAVVVGVLWFIVIKPPFPPLSGSGVFVNLGLVEIGMGNVQPEGVSAQWNAPTTSRQGAAPSRSSQQPVLTQDVEEAPVLAESKKSTATPAPAREAVKQPATTPTAAVTSANPQPKAIYPGTQTVSSAGEGTGQTPGDQGQPFGSPAGKDYFGQPGTGGIGSGGIGGSPQLGMSGRRIIYFPPIYDDSQKTGRVVVNIKVDRAGNVIFARATQKGSTTTDAYLFSLAEQAALQTKVNADHLAAEEQFGTITYTFQFR